MSSYKKRLSEAFIKKKFQKKETPSRRNGADSAKQIYIIKSIYKYYYLSVTVRKIRIRVFINSGAIFNAVSPEIVQRIEIKFIIIKKK